uniref:ribosomal protein L4 n=1 Tax=Goniotrichopsis reniformis TaxID=468933 RepID=UPI001FCD4C7B|nr:ribosomal protein L4 [Goniotrichopsis reniformis]UNJ14761.1 ribosomal protein L4 [Goniotrichopsis reniformis]
MATQVKVEYNVYDTEGTTRDKVSLDLKIATETSNYLVHRAMVKQLADKRQGTASTKTRSEVRGGGRKPWKQKGTGRARAGSKRSPLFLGGGVSFGPKPRSYSKKINRKEWRLALRTLWHNKSRVTTIIETLEEYCSSPSTKHFSELLKKYSIATENKILLIIECNNPNIYLSARNLPQVKVICATNLNVLDILTADHLLVTRKALTKIQEVFND